MKLLSRHYITVPLKSLLNLYFELNKCSQLSQIFQRQKRSLCETLFFLSEINLL